MEDRSGFLTENTKYTKGPNSRSLSYYAFQASIIEDVG